MTNWTDEASRKYKQVSRELATQFPHRSSALFMPAHSAVCVKTAEKNKMVHKKTTKLYLVERDPVKANALRTNVYDWKKEIYTQELHTVSLPEKLDYAWIDLTGTLNQKIHAWIQSCLSPNLNPNSIVCFTQGYCWRNNPWLKNTHEFVHSNHYESYAEFRQNVSVVQDSNIAFPVFLLCSALRDWNVLTFEPYRYRDTIDMVLFRFKLLSRKIPSLPLIGENQQKQTLMKRNHPCSPSLTQENQKMTPVPSAAVVIEAIFTANSPAYKAHATRKLNAYVAQKVKEGMKETQVRAAIAAHVTRRRKAV